MNTPAEKKHPYPDPYAVYQENMDRLKVINVSDKSSHSAPNSPIVNRGRKLHECEASKQSQYLSPMRAQNDGNSSFSNSLTEQRFRNRSLSPSPHRNTKLSPGSSPVSTRLINAHFLSQTTGKPGSFMLKKSEEILMKTSPLASPNVRSPAIQRKGQNTTEDNLPQNLPSQQSSSAYIIVSPAVEKSTIGFILQGSPKISQSQEQGNTEESANEIELKLSRKSLKDNKSKEAKSVKENSKIQPVHGTYTNEMRQENLAQGINIQEKPRRHHYIQYENPNADPAYLTPPREPRGSKDLAAELEKIFGDRLDKKSLSNLDDIAEHGTGSEHGNSENGENPDQKNEVARGPSPYLGFVLPPVYQSVPKQVEARDYAIPIDMKNLEVASESWEELKDCRYLRNNLEEDENDKDHHEATSTK